MKLKLKSHIVIQKQFNGNIAVLDFQKNMESYWVATGFAADTLQLLQQHSEKETILNHLETIYSGSRPQLEELLGSFLATLTDQNILIKPKTSTSASSLALKVLGRSSQKGSTPSVSQQKKKPNGSFHLTSLVSEEPLPAYADCVFDSDCPPGEVCTWDANACVLYCWPGGT